MTAAASAASVSGGGGPSERAGRRPQRTAPSATSSTSGTAGGRPAGRATNQVVTSRRRDPRRAPSITMRRSRRTPLLDGLELLEERFGGGRPLEDRRRARDLVDGLFDGLGSGPALQVCARLLVVLVHDALAGRAEQAVAHLSHAVQPGQLRRGLGGRGRGGRGP